MRYADAKAALKRRKERQARHKLKAAVREVSYPTTDWANHRKIALKPECECCGLIFVLRSPISFPPPVERHIHHIILKRLASQHGDPDAEINLLACCSKCHGRLKKCDNLVLKGDWVGAVAAANRAGILDRFRAAAKSYGFDISRIIV